MLNPVAGSPWGAIVLLLGLTGVIVGVVWLRRIAGRGPDKDGSSFRYRHGSEKERWSMGAEPRSFASTVLMLGRLAVILPIVLYIAAPRGPAAMFVDPPFDPTLLGFVGLIVGWLWLEKIARDVRIDRGSRRRLRLDRSGPTPRWIATRAGMAAGLAALILPAFLLVLAPDQFGQGTTPWWGTAVTAAGWTGLVIGNVWLYRTMRADPEPDAKAWRYRR